MRTTILKNCVSNIPAAVAIIIFMLFSSLRQTDDKDKQAPAVIKCCTGLCLPIEDLHKFMLDSLQGIEFEGGVYSKQDLREAINKLNNIDDSVFILNVLVNCNAAKRTALAVTSRHTNGVRFVSKTKRPCEDCPPKACCPKKVGIARIKRDCINYMDFNKANAENEADVLSSSQ